MQKQAVIKTLQQLRQTAKPRQFKQTIDMTINFKNIDFKKLDNQVDVDVQLPHPVKSGQGKVLLFVRDKQFAEEAKGIVDMIILEDQIKSISKKKASELVNQYAGFLAEGPVMLTVGKYLGQILAPKGKMPAPIPLDKQKLQSLTSQMRSVVKVSNRKGKSMPLVHISVGKEEMPDEDIAENALAVYQAVLPAIGNKETNIKSVLIKMTMSPALMVGAKTVPAEATS
ncbi:MAG: hypothetical protein Q8P05_03645 [Candidatus Diapherotrites archaeon]|nr:hypothetical protein [Candidatus Diapherotrites archaeon]